MRRRGSATRCAESGKRNDVERAWLVWQKWPRGRETSEAEANTIILERSGDSAKPGADRPAEADAYRLYIHVRTGIYIPRNQFRWC
jgi:hypothetical protein